MEGSDIFQELIHNRPLRDAFFPENSISNVLKTRQIAMKTEDLTSDERGSLAGEYAQQYLESKTNLEPRLKAVVSIGADPSARQIIPENGLVMSTVEGERTTHYLAKNVNEFNLDPIRFSITAKDNYGKQLEDALNEGRSFTLPAGELLEIGSSSPLMRSLFDGKDLGGFQLDVQPLLPKKLATKVLALRLVAGAGPTAKEIPYVPFQIAKMGRREITLASQGSLPLEVTLKFRPAENGISINMRPKLQGAEVQSLHPVIEFLDTLEISGQLEVVSLDPPGSLASVVGEFSSSLSISADLKRIIADAALVSRFFGKQIRVPEKYYRQEVDSLETLKAIATGESFFDIEMNGSFIKDSNQNGALEFLDGIERSIRVEHPAGWKVLKIFDESINPGPITIEAQKLSVVNPEETRKAYLSASDGDIVTFKMHCKGPCRYILGTPEPV
jgi:hypothetical protein